MVEAFAVEEGVSLLKKFAGPVIGAAILLAGGFGAAEAWEHQAHHPGVFGWSPFGRSLAQQRDEALAQIPARYAAGLRDGGAIQVKADRPYFDAWAARVKLDDAALLKARGDLAAAITQHDKFTTTQADQAFRLGRATCEARNATFPSPAASGPAAAGGVQHDGPDDFATLFKPGAFTAAP